MNITVTYDLFRLQALFLTELFYKAVAHDLLRRQVLSFTELFYFIMNVTVAHGCE